MIQRKQLQVAGNTVSQNPTVWLPLMIGYKTGIQKAILNIATKDELLDVKNWKNRGMMGQHAGGRWDTFDVAKLMIFS